MQTARVEDVIITFTIYDVVIVIVCDDPFFWLAQEHDTQHETLDR